MWDEIMVGNVCSDRNGNVGVTENFRDGSRGFCVSRPGVWIGRNVKTGASWWSSEPTKLAGSVEEYMEMGQP